MTIYCLVIITWKILRVTTFYIIKGEGSWEYLNIVWNLKSLCGGMEVLSCSDVQYVGESSNLQQGTTFLCDGDCECLRQGNSVPERIHKAADFTQNVEEMQKYIPGEDQNRVEGVSTIGVNCCGMLYPEHVAECQKLPSNFHDFEEGNLSSEKQGMKSITAFQKSDMLVDEIETELPSMNRVVESHLPDAEWLEGDKSMALWVKWRGKWQAGIRCERIDCPLSTLKARPTYDEKKYFVVFFPNSRNFFWADMLLVRPLHDFPQPNAHTAHHIGVEMVKDLTMPRRYIVQKLAVDMLNIIEQLNAEAMVENCRHVMAWKEFAMQASRCKEYSDLGRMLLELQHMILQCYINHDWLQTSFESWEQHCQSAQSAESIEMLKEELEDSILWNEVKALHDASVQPKSDSSWKTWKHEVMKWFSTSHPTACCGDTEQHCSDGPASMDLQISRKRPKLEVRRAEMNASQVENEDSQGFNFQTATIEVDSGFFNGGYLGNVGALVSQPHKEGISTEGASASGYRTDRWNEIVVEAGNSECIRVTNMEEKPVDGEHIKRSADSGNKYRQCLAFIEAKGRQCGRWASDGDLYCCVHLMTRSIGRTAKEEQKSPVNMPMCEGTTTHGTRCKHRSQSGSSFCKKHRLQNYQYPLDAEKTSSSSGHNLKRKLEEKITGSEASNCKEIVLIEVPNPVQENMLSAMEGKANGSDILVNNNEDSIEGNMSALMKKPDYSIEGKRSAESLRCIGSCNQNNNDTCLEYPSRYSLYCEKHLPTWLKRARNGKSRIISKDVFIDLLRDCSSQERKLNLHQACELFHRLVKSVLSYRNLVPKEVQLQWVLSEASKDSSVGEFLTELASREKYKLRKLWDFDAGIDKPTISSLEMSVPMPATHDSSNNIQETIRCKMCSEEFSDDQALGTHWMNAHKKEAQWLFRGYACANCMGSFTNKKLLETHVRETHGEQFLKQCILCQCIPCGSHFGDSDQLWLHVLSVHLIDLRQPTVGRQRHYAGQSSLLKLEQRTYNSMENDIQGQDGSRKFVCRFCGLKFDLLPDLGRHHQAAHMVSNPIGHRPSKRGIRYYAYKLKSGRLSRPKFNKGIVVTSGRLRNRVNSNLKKRLQLSTSGSTGGVRVQSQVSEDANLGRLSDHQCSTVANMLFSEIQKTKPRPSNLDIISVARSTCCKVSLQATLEEKYGALPVRLYLKAAKLCSELNISVEWHQEGFVCPRGCKSATDTHFSSPLVLRSNDFMEPITTPFADPVNEEWEIDEWHYVIDSRYFNSKPLQKTTVLCEDVSFGRESVPIACVVDEVHRSAFPILVDEESDDHNTRCSMPWEGFTYITKRLLDPSHGLDIESLQLGCACPRSTCDPEICDHVYLFDNDYEDAKDIHGKPMHGRFPYDEKGRIILEEGHLIYECNSMCSCDENCCNRVLQKGVQVKLEIVKTEKKGWAVRAGEAISRGTFVCEYIGEVLNDQEANRRSERYNNDGCSYMYDIGAHSTDMSGLTEASVSCVIDATKYGNVARFINHSCSPNLVNYQVLVESMDFQLAHIGLFAGQDISVGEELTYNYHYKPRPGGHPCYCGSSNCRGLVH